MSTLIACDYAGCKATRCVEWPGQNLSYYEMNDWTSLTTETPFQMKSNRESMPTHRYMLCPEHAALFSDSQWAKEQ